MTFTRRVLETGTAAGKQRKKINENFEELFRPKHLTATNVGGSSQSIANSTWTTVLTPTVAFNTTTISQNAGVWSFPVGEGNDGDNVWNCTACVAWDNTLASLQKHQRKVRVLLTRSGVEEVLATKDYLFDPAFGVSGEMAKGHHQVYSQIFFSPEYIGATIRMQVWHNAKVGGSPVSINLVSDLLAAPSFRLCYCGPYS